jgi:hypothetical protein
MCWCGPLAPDGSPTHQLLRVCQVLSSLRRARRRALAALLLQRREGVRPHRHARGGVAAVAAAGEGGVRVVSAAAQEGRHVQGEAPGQRRASVRPALLLEGGVRVRSAVAAVQGAKVCGGLAAARSLLGVCTLPQWVLEQPILEAIVNCMSLPCTQQGPARSAACPTCQPAAPAQTGAMPSVLALPAVRQHLRP